MTDRDETLTEALKRLGLRHQKSDMSGRRLILEIESGRPLREMSSKEGWELVRRMDKERKAT